MTGIKILAVNRKANYNYEIIDRIEAGLVLLGTEIKSMREGRVEFSDSYARPSKGELWLENAHIGAYSSGGAENHQPKRPRKLLLHKGQIDSLTSSVDERGLTLVPLRLYLKHGKAKIELGVARGRKRYDKRRVLKEKEREREAQEAIRRRI
ncbi:SsrA-binding protein SmpB [Dehalococcoidia bacterium]|nr:SsrA-binding protein SmpB [Dehalococcoidia bacterium]